VGKVAMEESDGVVGSYGGPADRAACEPHVRDGAGDHVAGDRDRIEVVVVRHDPCIPQHVRRPFAAARRHDESPVSGS
jgi:hypothetical protein